MSTADPFALLSAAISQPPNSEQQFLNLQTLRSSLEAQPGRIPMLLSTLVVSVSRDRGESGLLRTWVLEMISYALGKAQLPIESRTQVAASSMDVLEGLLGPPDTATVKLVIQCYASLYPVMFRSISTTRQSTTRSQWDTLSRVKSRILEIVTDDKAQIGLKLVAIKFAQRVILVQTKGVTDPRLQNKNDPNIALIPSNHAFLTSDVLEAEAVKLLQTLVTNLFTSSSPDLLCAIINGWAPLIAHRPLYQGFVVSTLVNWTPKALQGAPGVGASGIKSVEKCVRIMLGYILRNPQAAGLAQQISDGLAVQATRMEVAANEERERRNSKKRTAPSTLTPDIDSKDAKRPRLDAPTPIPAAPAAAKNLLASFDFRTLPPQLVTELIVASLGALNEKVLENAVQARRQALQLIQADNATSSTSSLGASGSGTSTITPLTASALPKQDPVDPLKMDIDEEEIEYEPETINQRLNEDSDTLVNPVDSTPQLTLTLARFTLPSPKRYTDAQRELLVSGTFGRLRKSLEDETADDGESMEKLKMLLLIRFVTRGANREGNSGIKSEGEETSAMIRGSSAAQKLREQLCQYVLDDLGARLTLANTWLNEEWYNDQIRKEYDSDWISQYDIWLSKIVNGYRPFLTPKDRSFHAFILDLPTIPNEILNILQELCLEPEKMQVGFPALREIVATRPPTRKEAIRILLELTTHPEKVPRNAAIITVKRWVPDSQPMDRMTKQFASQMLRRLQTKPAGAMEEEDGQLPLEALVETPYLSPTLKLPAERSEVLQHVELLFALCVKAPDLLDEVFSAYATMDISVQEAVQDLITALIRSLGSSNANLLTILRRFPLGAESLVLRVITIFTTGQRPSGPLVALVKSLVSERDLSPQFIIPIIGEMDKVDIMRHLPRIVSTLNGTPEQKALVRSVFTAIVSMPPDSFGSVTSNLPRVRQSELLTPAELMVLLHHSEKEIGLKSCIEAIGICFSITEVFRSEILGVVMQQIVDEQALPTLFLRTVIQAVSTYKSLVGFVSTTLLSRLITKRVWTDPRLWEGFIMCAKKIAPASFGALLQLPKDQLRELVEKQPGLKSGLREFVIKKSGNNHHKLASFLEIFGDDAIPNAASAAGQAPHPGSENPSNQPPFRAVSPPTVA